MSAPWASHGGLISHYDSLVCSGSLQEDDQQRAALLQLEQLNRVMTDYTNIPSNEKEDNTQEVWVYMCQTEQCNLWMFTVKKKLSSLTFSQTPALALCHCLICCGTVVCRSKQLQPVCVCGVESGRKDQTKHLLDNSTAPYWVRTPHLSLASVMRGRHCLGKRFPAPHSIWGNKHKHVQRCALVLII